MLESRSQVITRFISLGLLLVLAIPTVKGQAPEKASRLPEQRQEQPPGRGFIRPRMDLSHLTGKRIPEGFRAIQVPVRWDWREQGKVTSIKNQGGCGSCYSFASLADIESKMLIDGEGSFDFSENNAKECNWYDRSCSGGSYYDMADWFSKKGTVLESCDPYVAANVSCNSSCPYKKTLLDWRIICSDNIPTTTTLQEYIYLNGPVYTSLYAGDDNDSSWKTEFNSYDGSYTLHYTGDWATNHAVLIVGWDDTLSHAGGAGAWIVKNSWGTSWGGTCGYGSESGYFAIAYGSGKIGMWSSYIHGWQDYDQDGEILYYDEGGWATSWGYGNTTAWGLSKFVLSSQAYVYRIEFWTNDATSDIDVYVYDNFDGSSLSGLLASQLNASFDEAGYHSVALGSPPEVAAGNDVYAALKFTNSTYTYPVVVDDQSPIETNKTYISSTGSSGSWYELGASQGYDVAIRVRTSPTLIVSVDDIDGQSPHTFSLSHNYPNPFNPMTTIDYTLEGRAHVDISIYNLLGQRVSAIVDDVKSAGQHTIHWDGRDSNGQPVASGIYFYKLRAGDFAESKKMLLLK